MWVRVTSLWGAGAELKKGEREPMPDETDVERVVDSTSLNQQSPIREVKKKKTQSSKSKRDNAIQGPHPRDPPGNHQVPMTVQLCRNALWNELGTISNPLAASGYDILSKNRLDVHP